MARKLASASDHKRCHLPCALCTYREFERKLIEELAAWRSARRDGKTYNPTLFTLADVTNGNPLEVERRLLELKWEFCERLIGLHFADGTWYTCYYLKLTILTKLASFDAARGSAVLREACGLPHQPTT
jgi:hypothetical protein